MLNKKISIPLKHLSLVLLPVLLTCACIQESELEIPLQEDVLVLNAIINPDSTISALLANSRTYASGQELSDVRDADVRLYEDDRYIGSSISLSPMLTIV